MRNNNINISRVLEAGGSVRRGFGGDGRPNMVREAGQGASCLTFLALKTILPNAGNKSQLKAAGDLDMRTPFMGFAVLFVAQAGFCHAQTMLVGKTAVVFATVDEGRRILGTPDDFVQRMSPFDRAARLKTARQVSQAEFVGNALCGVPLFRQRTERHSSAFPTGCRFAPPKIAQPCLVPWGPSQRELFR